MKTYPIMLNLNNKRVLIVGGGYVATRKLKNLIGKGAKITVISPKFTDTILELHSKNLIKLEKKYLTIDMVDYVKSFFMVIFATDDYELQDKYEKLLTDSNLLFVRTDKRDASRFITPTVMEIDNITIATSTQGLSPLYNKYIHEQIKEKIDLQEIANKMEMYSEVREMLKIRYQDIEDRKVILKNIQDYNLSELTELLDKLKQGIDII